ncbi:hypothetical protein SAMN04488168_12328 [Bacillus sp. 491mf]|nr:hypothetical protein SAMN04488168_12328 [Bacillus sp. 491mf]
MNKFLVATLYTVIILISFFQLEAPESQHVQSLGTNIHDIHLKADPGGG